MKKKPAEHFLNELVKPHMGTPERVLIAGSRVYGSKVDRRTLYDGAEVVGVDLQGGTGVDLVADLESVAVGKFDHVDCCSMLEHCQRPWRVAENLEDSLTLGGSILISVPFVWRVHAYPSDYWRMTREAMPILFPRISWRLNVYLVNGQVQTVVKGLNQNNKRYMQRAQVVCFGNRVK